MSVSEVCSETVIVIKHTAIPSSTAFEPYKTVFHADVLRRYGFHQFVCVILQ